MTFDQFMFQVDNAISELTDYQLSSSSDLPDFDYRLCFDSNRTPRHTARYALIAADYF